MTNKNTTTLARKFGRGLVVTFGIAFLAFGVLTIHIPTEPGPYAEESPTYEEESPTYEEEFPTYEEAMPSAPASFEEVTMGEGDEWGEGQKKAWRVSLEGVPGNPEEIRTGDTATLKVFAYLPGDHTESGVPLFAPNGSKLTWHLAGGPEETFFGEGIAISNDGVFELEITAPSGADVIFDVHADMWIGSLRLPDGITADPSLDYEIVYEVPQTGDTWKLDTFLDQG